MCTVPHIAATCSKTDSVSLKSQTLKQLEHKFSSLKKPPPPMQGVNYQMQPDYFVLIALFSKPKFPFYLLLKMPAPLLKLILH